jgi:hypothetical protein
MASDQHGRNSRQAQRRDRLLRDLAAVADDVPLLMA